MLQTSDHEEVKGKDKWDCSFFGREHILLRTIPWEKSEFSLINTAWEGLTLISALFQG